MKKIVLAVLIAMLCGMPVKAQYVGGTDMATAANSALKEAAIEGGCIDGLLKNTGYSSVALNETVETAWSYYKQGWCSDINAVDNGGNTILHLIVRAKSAGWPTQLDQWVKAGVKDVPNRMGKTALQELEEDIDRVIKDNELYRGVFDRRVPAEYTKARKVLKNTPEEKERKELRKKAEKKEILESIIRSFETSK